MIPRANICRASCLCLTNLLSSAGFLHGQAPSRPGRPAAFLHPRRARSCVLIILACLSAVIMPASPLPCILTPQDQFGEVCRMQFQAPLLLAAAAVAVLTASFTEALRCCSATARLFTSLAHGLLSYQPDDLDRQVRRGGLAALREPSRSCELRAPCAATALVVQSN